MNKYFATVVLSAAFIAFAVPSFAGEADDSAALAKALPQASVSLSKALQASEHEGKPISAKFELEDGALQLSVYTSKAKGFKEVIVDHKSGAIKKSETITDTGDLKAAHAQRQRLSKAAVSLSQAVDSAVSANDDARAVSVMPKMKAGHPIAEVTLLTGAAFKKVTEKLD